MIFSLVKGDQTCEAYSNCDQTIDLYKVINVFFITLIGTSSFDHAQHFVGFTDDDINVIIPR